MPAGFRSEPLGQHDRSAFSCGVPTLDSYFHERAGQDQKRKLAAPYVLVENDSGTIVGYYTLSSCSIQPANLPTTMTRRLPRYQEYPAILIGRPALDRRFQGRKLGRRLLFDALHRCLVLSSQLGAVAVVVDAKDATARAFYEHVGFIPLESHDLKLYVPMGTISGLLGAEAPSANTR